MAQAFYGFRITGQKGFHVSFANGWTVSVQFGPANYCDNYDREIGVDEAACGKGGSGTAETAVLDPDGNLVPLGRSGGELIAAVRDADGYSDTDSVQARQTPEDVLRLLNWAASQPAAVGA